MNISKNLTRKLAGATVAGALLAGVGMSASLAATPSTKGDAAGVYDLTEVTNLTPYTWTFLNEPGASGPYDVAPPQTVAPGQTAMWAADDIYNQHWSTTNFTFTDSAGHPHDVEVMDVSDGYTSSRHTLLSYSRDSADWNGADSTASFHMASDPDGSQRHVDAVWNTPTAITIDASKDQATADEIVNSQLPRVAASAISWTPTSTTPTFTQVDKQRISSQLLNYSSAPATLGTSNTTEVGQSTTFSESTTVSLSTKIFGVASKVAASVTTDKSWTASNSITIGQSADISAGCVGYLQKWTSVASMTGTLKFTTPDGISYTITNVSISRGDIINPSVEPPIGLNISATQSPLQGSTATCTATN